MEAGLSTNDVRVMMISNRAQPDIYPFQHETFIVLNDGRRKCVVMERGQLDKLINALPAAKVGYFEWESDKGSLRGFGKTANEVIADCFRDCGGVGVEDVAKYELTGRMCMESMPCKHAIKITLNDGRSYSGWCESSAQINRMIQALPSDKVDLGSWGESHFAYAPYVGPVSDYLRGLEWKEAGPDKV